MKNPKVEPTTLPSAPKPRKPRATSLQAAANAIALHEKRIEELREKQKIAEAKTKGKLLIEKDELEGRLAEINTALESLKQ